MIKPDDDGVKMAWNRSERERRDGMIPAMRTIHTHVGIERGGDTGFFVVPALYVDLYAAIRSVDLSNIERCCVCISFMWLRWAATMQVDFPPPRWITQRLRTRPNEPNRSARQIR